MKILLIAVAILLALIVVAGLAFVVTGRERSWERIAGSPDRGRLDFSNLKRSPTTNDALACTDELHDACDFALPSYAGPTQKLAESLAAHIEAVDPLARRVDDGAAPEHLRYVTYSPTMRFPDLINIEIVPLQDGRQGILAYARAQLGRDDLGANRRRLEGIFKDFQQ